MTDPFARSVFLAVPAAKRADANLVYQGLERGPDTFSIACSPSGAEPATHYLAHDASMSETLSNTALNMPQNGGTLPVISGMWGDVFTGAPTEVAAETLAKSACAAMQVFVATNVDGQVHKASALSGLSLQVIQPPL